MTVLRFEGYSDDTFGCQLVDHDNCANGKPIVFRVADGNEAFFVWGHYAPGPAAGWMIGVAPDEDPGEFEAKPLPAWPMRLTTSERPYSPALEIEAPEGVTVALHREA